MENNKQKKEIYEMLSGMFETSSKDMYVGRIREGLPDGQGILFTHDGATYIGKWRKGRFHGMGRFECADGTKYTMEWKNGRVLGKGLEIRSDDKKYIRSLRNLLRKCDFKFKQMHVIRYYQDYPDVNKDNIYNKRRSHESLIINKNICKYVTVLPKGRVSLGDVQVNNLGILHSVYGPEGEIYNSNGDLETILFH